MATEVYGRSDDLIEFDGDFVGEANPGCEAETLVVMSDGTVLSIKYGKPGNLAIWQVSPVHKGPLFDRLDVCTDEDAERYSDTAHFKDGIKWAYAATEYERVH